MQKVYPRLRSLPTQATVAMSQMPPSHKQLWLVGAVFTGLKPAVWRVHITSSPSVNRMQFRVTTGNVSLVKHCQKSDPQAVSNVNEPQKRPHLLEWCVTLHTTSLSLLSLCGYTISGQTLLEPCRVHLDIFQQSHSQQHPNEMQASEVKADP